MRQSIVFTLLPQDEQVAGGDYRAAVFVSPHLTPDGPGAVAKDFPAFGDWPAVVTEARIIVERRDGQTLELGADAGPLRSDLWQAYLAPLPVRGWVFHDLTQTEIRSYPAQAIHALAQGLYRAVAAASAGGHPDPLSGGLRDLGAAYGELGGGSRDERDKIVDEWLRSRQAQRREQEAGDRPREPGGMAPRVRALTPGQALGDARNAALDLAEARRFYDRPEERDPDASLYAKHPDPAYQPPQLDKAEPDFHDILGALADHPELLRALGIIIELSLPAAFVGNGGDLRVALDHPALAGNPVAAQPWTRTTANGRFFQPMSETGDFVDGVLALDDPDRYDVTQVDIDSAAMLVEQRVANVYPIARAASDGEPVTGDLPALRSTGFTVTRLRRAMILTDRIERSKANADAIAAGADVVLFAEDLVRGFRVDVHDGNTWRSLMHRKARYLDRTTRAEVLTVADQEAYLKASSLTSVPDAAVARAYLHESLFGWDGWSLALPRPGKHLRGRTDEPGSLADEGEPFPGPLELEVRTELLKGTLPRLRYGAAYRFRVRAVDLAGHSTEFAADDPATRAAPFRRFQPVSHPTTVPRHAFTEGESALRLVVRSGVDADNSDPTAPVVPVEPATYAAALAAGSPRVFAVFRSDSQRHLAPPKTSQQEAELLGRFDDAIGLPAGPAAVYRAAFARAQREQGTLADRVILSATNPAGSSPAAGIRLVPPLAEDADHTPAELAALLAGLKRGEAPKAGFVIVHDTDALAVPYLPDPLASGVALRVRGAGTARGWTHQEVLGYGGQWPDLATYRLVLIGGPSPQVTVAGTVITVALPPGGTAVVRVSSSLADAAVLERLGMWEWIATTVPAASVADVVAGAHQMITPGEEVSLVHATQRPLVRPTLQPGFAAARAYGETFTRFKGVLRSQSATTGRLDLDGSWAEWFDQPGSEMAPTLLGGHGGHAFGVTIADGQDDLDLETGTAGPPDAPDLGDLKHEFGDHMHRLVTYHATGTTRFREYLPPAETSDPARLQVVGLATAIHVPNSARPVVPVIHSVIPTFTWQDEPPDPLDPLARQRSRAGGLRVWLERPWYTSGEDEMLGVVLSGADEIIAGADLRRQYVSLWGKDPIRSGGRLTASVPRPRDFSGDGLLEMDFLTLAETAGRHPGVTVVGYPVRYAPKRDKWYADLFVDPGEAYWPFLRLSLARFQPYSVANAHLSPVVVADFVQLTNRRTASITRPDDERVTVTVTGIEERRYAPGLFPPAPIDFEAEAAFLGRAFGQASRGVRAWVERRGATKSDLDWQRVGDIVELARIDEDEVMRVWSGEVPLEVPVPLRRPGTNPGGAGSGWRLVITEWEALRYDTRDDTGGPIERIVYLDRFPL